jgi:hypothetical protein
LSLVDTHAKAQSVAQNVKAECAISYEDFNLGQVVRSLREKLTAFVEIERQH